MQLASLLDILIAEEEDIKKKLVIQISWGKSHKVQVDDAAHSNETKYVKFLWIILSKIEIKRNSLMLVLD